MGTVSVDGMIHRSVEAQTHLQHELSMRRQVQIESKSKRRSKVKRPAKLWWCQVRSSFDFERVVKLEGREPEEAATARSDSGLSTHAESKKSRRQFVAKKARHWPSDIETKQKKMKGRKSKARHDRKERWGHTEKTCVKQQAELEKCRANEGGEHSKIMASIQKAR